MNANTDDFLRQLENAIDRKADQILHEKMDAAIEWLKYQLVITCGEMQSGVSEYYDPKNSTLSELSFMNDPLEFIDITVDYDMETNGNKKANLHIAFKEGVDVTTHINSAVYLAYKNMKLMIGGGDNGSVDN